MLICVEQEKTDATCNNESLFLQMNEIMTLCDNHFLIINKE